MVRAAPASAMEEHDSSPHERLKILFRQPNLWLWPGQRRFRRGARLSGRINQPPDDLSGRRSSREPEQPGCDSSLMHGVPQGDGSGLTVPKLTHILPIKPAVQHNARRQEEGIPAVKRRKIAAAELLRRTEIEPGKRPKCIRPAKQRPNERNGLRRTAFIPFLFLPQDAAHNAAAKWEQFPACAFPGEDAQEHPRGPDWLRCRVSRTAGTLWQKQKEQILPPVPRCLDALIKCFLDKTVLVDHSLPEGRMKLLCDMGHGRGRTQCAVINERRRKAALYPRQGKRRFQPSPGEREPRRRIMAVRL